jgi:hypothetical protein
MKLWRPIGYIFLSSGLFIIMFFIITGFLSTRLIAETSPQLAAVAFAGIILPWLFISSLCFIIGGVSLHFGREKNPEMIMKKENNSFNIIERINRLESIMDNNFEVINKRIDSIEEQQKLASQNTLIKAKQ